MISQLLIDIGRATRALSIAGKAMRFPNQAHLY
jgi:hypothetical protein